MRNSRRNSKVTGGESTAWQSRPTPTPSHEGTVTCGRPLLEQVHLCGGSGPWVSPHQSTYFPKEPTPEQALPEGTAAWAGPAMKQKETRKERQRETTSPDHIHHPSVDHCLTERTVIICSDKAWGEQRSLEWRWV